MRNAVIDVIAIVLVDVLRAELDESAAAMKIEVGTLCHRS
jgi:hypothetical protein